MAGNVLQFPNSTAHAQTPFKPDPGVGGTRGAEALASPAAGKRGGAQIGYASPFDVAPSLGAQRQGIDPNALGSSGSGVVRPQGSASASALQEQATVAASAQHQQPPAQQQAPPVAAQEVTTEPGLYGMVKRQAAKVPWWGWGLAAVGVYGAVQYYRGKPLVPFLKRRKRNGKRNASDESED